MKQLITKTKAYFALIFTAALLSSCAEDILSESPKGFVSDVNFYTTLDEAESGLAGAMSSIPNGVLFPDDISYNGYTDFDNNGIRDAIIVLDIEYGINNWSGNYAAVTNTNLVVQAVNEGKIENVSDTELQQIEGQAKFIRAFSYFNLVRLYGEIPLILEDSPNPVTNTYEKSSVEDVYSQIVSDLEDAVSFLPENWPGAPARPTRWAAMGMLAKVHLTMATAPLNLSDHYEQAASLSKDIIDNSGISLIPDVTEVFQLDNKRAAEMMFAFEATDDDANSLPVALASYNSGGFSTGAMDTLFAAVEFPDQPRRDAYIQLMVPDPVFGDGSLIPWQETFEVAPTIAKFNYPYVNVEDIMNNGVFPVNVPILRYAEVLLIFAEADNMANGGPTVDAVDAINQVINRANGSTGSEALATIGMSASEFDQKVISERKFEFCFETGVRWFDMVRKGLTENHTRTNLFPIPEYDANLIGQNEGYN